MSTNQPQDELSPAEIEFLNHIIRRSREDAGETALPDAPLLARYLKGEATPKEVRSVYEALERSESLREEVAYLAGLFDREVQSRFDQTPSPRRDATADPQPGEQGAPESENPVKPRQDRWPWRLRLVWGGLMAVVAAAVIVIMTMSGRTPVLAWSEGAGLTRDQFRIDSFRGANPALPRPQDQTQAATLAFLEAAEWDGSGFRLHPKEGQVPPGRPMSVDLVGASRAFATALPAKAENPEVWFLSLPSLKAYRAELTRERVKITWPGGDPHGLITISYGLGGEFAATPAQELVRR